MMKEKQVLVPLSLLDKVADLLSYWDTSFEDASLQASHAYVLRAVLKKLLAAETRASYTKMLFAENGGKRLEARQEYLKRKHDYENGNFL
jgi:hypothetical protein